MLTLLLCPPKLTHATPLHSIRQSWAVTLAVEHITAHHPGTQIPHVHEWAHVVPTVATGERRLRANLCNGQGVWPLEALKLMAQMGEDLTL